MTPSSGEDADRRFAERIAAIVPGSPTVESQGSASVGAQRRTVFVDLVRDGERTPAVVQIASTELAQLATETEASLLREARRSGVPVPELLAWDAASATIVTRRIEGESIPRRILRRCDAEPGLAERLAVGCGRALAAIHRIPFDGLDGLPDASDPLRYCAELEALLDGLSDPIPSLRLGLRWLRQHAPEAPARSTVVHGDFRNGNLLVGDTGLAAVLDWELAHRGDPMEDLAWLCLRTWRFGRDSLEAGGFAPLAALRHAYERAGGVWSDAAFRWWSVARTVWWALGLARQAQVFLDGGTRSIVLAASGRRVVELEYDLLTLIRR